MQTVRSGGAARSVVLLGLAASIMAPAWAQDAGDATAAGQTLPYWEFNLRFKTDSSATGPRPGEPVMVPAAMQGDRAQVVFSNPAEISAFIKEKC